MRTLLTTTAFGAALVLSAMTGASAQQGGEGKFCLQTGSGNLDCSYQTEAQCKATMKGTTTESCIANPKMQTPAPR